MTKQQKYKILICLSLLIWIGLIVFLILIATKVIHIDGIWGAIITLIASPLLSQLFGAIPKVIHYNKVKKEVQKVAEKEKKAQELIDKNIVNRERLF